MMKKLAIVILAFAASLSAADFSGVWNGTGGKVDSRYGVVPQTAQMTVVQAGSSFTGTLKIGSGKPMQIKSGAVSGTQLTFAIVTGAAQITGSLTQNGTQLSGRMTASNGQTFNFVFTKS